MTVAALAVGAVSFTLAVLACYWIRGAALLRAASAAYARGEMATGDALAARARYWTKGIGIEGNLSHAAENDHPDR